MESSLIRRVALAVSAAQGDPEAERDAIRQLRNQLIAEGVEEHVIYLAVKAGELLAKTP